MKQTIVQKYGQVAWSAFAAALYGVVSISMTFSNKAVLTYYKFDYANIMILLQHMFTLMLLIFFKSVGAITYPSFNMEQAKMFLPVALLYTLNVIVALTSLSQLNIPMYGVIKRLTVLPVLIGEYYLLGKSSSTQIKESVAVILLGAIVAGAGDLSFDLGGYAMGLLSCSVQAGYLLYVAKSGIETGISTFGLLFYNNLLSLPFVVLIVLLTGELDGASKYPSLYDSDFLVVLLSAVALGGLLNYAIFLCTTVNSALTTTIMGQAKNVGSSLIGFFAFGGVKFNFVNVLGMVINSGGGIWYAYLKYMEKKNKGDADKR